MHLAWVLTFCVIQLSQTGDCSGSSASRPALAGGRDLCRETSKITSPPAFGLVRHGRRPAYTAATMKPTRTPLSASHFSGPRPSCHGRCARSAASQHPCSGGLPNCFAEELSRSCRDLLERLLSWMLEAPNARLSQQDLHKVCKTHQS